MGTIEELRPLPEEPTPTLLALDRMRERRRESQDEVCEEQGITPARRWPAPHYTHVKRVPCIPLSGRSVLPGGLVDSAGTVIMEPPT